MQKKSFLVYLAYYLSSAVFGFACLATLLYIIALFVPFPWRFGDMAIGVTPSKGYTIPVRMTVQKVPDTTIHLKRTSPDGSQSTRITVSSYWDEPYVERDSTTKALLADTANIEKMVVSKWIVHPGSDDKATQWSFGGRDHYEVLDKQVAASPLIPYIPSLESKVEINVLGKTKWQNFMLSIHGYLGYFLYLFISFHVMRLLQSLHQEISFMHNLHKRLFLIGKVLVYSQLIYFMFTFVYAKYFGNITLQTADSDHGYYQGIQVSFYPTGGGSFLIFGIGVGLIILAKLVKYGQSLEKEAAFTV